MFMFSSVFRRKSTYFLLLYFLFILGWWLKLLVTGTRETDENYIFGFAYALIALFGAVYGFYISRAWGGFRSLVGRGIIFLSLGLLGEWFGQSVWSYYNLIARVEVPYPSIADIGYFSIIPFYALGMWSFAKAAGARFSLKTLGGKLAVVIIPVVMVTISYFLFLKNLQPDFADPIRTFLDFGYPGGEAITISIALITFQLSRGILGGKMKGRILYLIGALVAQYITDYTFLYQAAAGTYYNAGVVDLMYATSFVIMALGLSSLKFTRTKDGPA